MPATTTDHFITGAYDEPLFVEERTQKCTVFGPVSLAMKRCRSVCVAAMMLTE